MKFYRLICFIFIITFLFLPITAVRSAPPEIDPHSYSRPHEIAVTSVALNLDVNFDTKTISGSATFKLDNKTGADTLYLDTKDLVIHSVTAVPGNQTLEYKVGPSNSILGEPLSIHLPQKVRSITVHYETKPSAGALNWLEPEQTLSKKPFLFSLSAPILARTWMPCQDTPSVRTPYKATVRTRNDLLALMSARNPKAKSSNGQYSFIMPQAVPAYLIALAVGDLEYRDLGHRSGVYAEPSLINAASYEFAESEKILKATENLFGPFLWERADLLILPYSFPYGGMENPRLTFLNAATVVGDRSMVNLVAHEYAHYWSGNLVLPANWNHFWLNEGITSYAEIRVLEAVYGKSVADQMEYRNRGELQGALTDLKDNPADTHLRLNLAGRDPEDGINAIAYQKGEHFLRMIEETIGRRRFNKFLRSYFRRFKFKSITSDDLAEFIDQTLIAENPSLKEKLKISEWIDGPGLPQNAPIIASERATQIHQVARNWKKGEKLSSLNAKTWTAFDWVSFLDILGDEIPASRMIEFDEALKVSRVQNPEVLFRWYKLVIQNSYAAEYQHLKEFLLKMGRGKYIKPLYKALAQTPEGKKMALEIFSEAKKGYHPIMQKTCQKILLAE